nr:MAG TPA: hypothetical protein [Caudoviricetes sp.]
MWQDSLKPALWRWMVGTLIALAYAAMTGSCTPQPAAGRMTLQQRQADKETAAVAAVYGRMSDQERMRGIVYEPTGE